MTPTRPQCGVELGVLGPDGKPVRCPTLAVATCDMPHRQPDGSVAACGRPICAEHARAVGKLFLRWTVGDRPDLTHRPAFHPLGVLCPECRRGYTTWKGAAAA